jgi:cobalt-precorrin 5A hydrolase/precorrin-3B C17-methyltransferase
MTAILVITPAALAVAERVRAALPGARLHGLAERIDGADIAFTDTAAHLRDLFAAGTPIVALCATGILIRALGPVLADKKAEPPVLAVAPDGSAVVPLLGGHHGANALARTLAAALGCPAAVTTAGDVALGVALDEPPPGWRVANPEAAKPVVAALLAGKPVRLEVEAGDAGWLGGVAFADDGKLAVRVTDHAVQPDDGELVLHPPALALGVGCERGTPPDALAALVAETLDAEGLAPGAVACVASLDLKADEPAVHALARSLGVPARFFAAAELEREAPRLANPSAVVFRETGCHGVAEGAALAAAGAESRLVVAKVKGERCTVAIARAAAAIDPLAVGHARGKLLVVGIGPGAECWRTPEAGAAIAAAGDLVGYGLYLDLLGPAAAGKRRHESGLGAETERARMALDLAAEGRVVALVCSGDAGIYALATLVFELMDRERRPEWLRLDVAVVPGVSALQAAAARAGAPVNHDFCTISLSDLLTPWPTIERRLEAAAAADFVVCFYNPVSQRRQDQLVRARDILLTGRPADTPVVLARQLGRPGETVEIIGLGELTAERADMLTMVVVGNSETRRFTAAGRERVYTPRGYAKKL